MKKILILTLGTGIKSEEEKKTNAIPLLEDRIYGTRGTYQLTNYQFKKNEVIENISFVAEPLIENYKPDYVYVLGTQNSAWSTFWINFYKKENWDDSAKLNATEIIRPVWDIENAFYDKSKINEFRTVIQKVYEKYLLNLLNIQKIKVVLLPYGINKEELDFIYNTIFNQFENDFKDDERLLGTKEKYEVAFDITHSFRSLPIYNYAVLTYFKQITRYEVNIKEIYYGMLEAKKICDGVAPIVQLGEISNIMDLTSAVAEFNNTGSVKSLILFLQQVKEENPSVEKMLDVLNEFDWATGTNSGSLLIESIGKLNELVNEQVETKNIYDDIKIALRKVLEKPVFDDLQISLKDVKNAKTAMEYVDYQLVLSQWYLEQHRYSQSACIACETLKSYVFFLYAKAKKTKVSKDNMVSKAARKQIDLWIQENNSNAKIEAISAKCQIETEFLKEVFKSNEKARSLRNSSAHILQRSGNIEVLTDYISIIKKLRKVLIEKMELATIENTKNTTALASKPNNTNCIDKQMVENIKSREELKNLILTNGKICKSAMMSLRIMLSKYILEGLKIMKNDEQYTGKENELLHTLIETDRYIAWNSIVEGNKVHIPPFDINDAFKLDRAKEIIEQHKFVFSKNIYTFICDEERYYKFLVDLICYKLIMNEIKNGPVRKKNIENFRKVVDELFK